LVRRGGRFSLLHKARWSHRRGPVAYNNWLERVTLHRVVWRLLQSNKLGQTLISSGAKRQEQEPATQRN
jgi:hypothetical protein